MSQPPISGPEAGATMTVRPYRAKAWLRFAGGKLSANMDWVVGCRPPPPRPWKILAISIIGRLVAKAQPTELAVKTATQIR